MVGIPNPPLRFKQYPHQLSGGLRQRVVIAMAIACDPKVIIADEPTTALDVTVQAEILGLLRKLRDTLDTAIVLITHDMGVVADMADRVIVMYQGEIVEDAPVRELFASPKEDYTRSCSPRCRCSASARRAAACSRHRDRLRQHRGGQDRRGDPAGRRRAGSRDRGGRVGPGDQEPGARVPGPPWPGKNRAVDDVSLTSPRARSSAWSASPARASRPSAAARSAARPDRGHDLHRGQGHHADVGEGASPAAPATSPSCSRTRRPLWTRR